MVRVEIVSLGSPYIGEAELPSQIRVLTKVFFDSAPPRFSRKIEHGSQNHANTGRARFCRDGRTRSLRNFRVPCGSEIDRSGKYSPLIESVKALLDKQSRYT